MSTRTTRRRHGTESGSGATVSALLLIAALLLATLTGCGGSGDEGLEPQTLRRGDQPVDSPFALRQVSVSPAGSIVLLEFEFAQPLVLDQLPDGLSVRALLGGRKRGVDVSTRLPDLAVGVFGNQFGPGSAQAQRDGSGRASWRGDRILVVELDASWLEYLRSDTTLIAGQVFRPQDGDDSRELLDELQAP